MPEGIGYGSETETEDGRDPNNRSLTDEQKKVGRTLRLFKRAFQYKKALLKQMEQDMEFYLGWQWDEDAYQKLVDRGVRPLVINKIRPIIQMILGIESQNRTDAKVFPEGAEDSIIAEVATRLLKNMSKRSQINYKISEALEDKLAVGEGWLEPFLQFQDQLHLGEMRWRKSHAWNFFTDPASIEYDLSDAEYNDKITYDLTADQMKQLYPDMEDEIDRVLKDKKGGKINIETIGTDLDMFGAEIQRKGYNEEDDTGDLQDMENGEPLFDLLEHYYKKYVRKYFVLDLKRRDWKLVEDKEEADAFVAKATENDPPDEPSVKVVERLISEIWVCTVIGNCDKIFYEGPAWSFPSWKSYPAVPFWCYRVTAPIRKAIRHLRIQGITRGLKDLNRELNKRRTQELLHLNSSANSGWISEKGAWVDKERVRKFGATPGATLEYKQGYAKPERIFPMALSAGHAQLAEMAGADLKEASGVNTDLLAMNEGGSDSGRAIHLRQKQGLVMVQIVFDHLSRSKDLANRFQLSQLSEMYDVEEAMRVLGEAFLQENFSEPVITTDPQTGVQLPAIDPTTGQVQMQFNEEKARGLINQVLTDSELGKFDVYVGEAISSETIKYANYLMLQDMAQSGMPIPPDVLIDESLLPEATKQKIKEAFLRAQQAQEQTPKSKTANK